MMEVMSKDYATWYKATLSTILIIEMLAGVISNIAVLFSYHIDKKFNHTVGDMFITNMNIVDILICLVSIPMSITALLSESTPPLFCFFHEASVLFANVASAVNVLVISLDRHDKILHTVERRFTPKNVRWIISLTWLLAIVGFCTPFFGIEPTGFKAAVEADAVNGSRHCYVWISLSSRHFYYELYAIPVFFIASSVMIYAYYGILQVTKVKSIHSALVRATTLNMQTKDPTKNGGRRIAAVNNVIDPERRVSRTTTIIILTFIVCWGPHTIISIAIVAYGKPIPLIDLFEWWLLALAYTTTLMHPILYVFMRRNFRRALASSWLSRCFFQNRIGPNSTPTHSGARSPAKTGAHRDELWSHRRQKLTKQTTLPVLDTTVIHQNEPKSVIITKSPKSDPGQCEDTNKPTTWVEPSHDTADGEGTPGNNATITRAIDNADRPRISWSTGTLKKIKQFEYTVGGNKDDVKPLDVENVE